MANVHHLPVYQRLIKVLDDDEVRKTWISLDHANTVQQGMETLLRYPLPELLHTFNEQQKANMSAMIQYFSHRPSGDDGEGGNEGTSPGGQGRKRKRDAGGGEPTHRAPNNPWKPFLNTKSLQLEGEYEKFVERFGDSPVQFLNDTKNLVLFGRYNTEKRHIVEQAFVDCFQYTMHLKSRQGRDRIRWLFSMLFYFDLARLVNAGAAGRVGHLMEKEVFELLRVDVLRKLYPKALPMERFSEWSVRGSKLNVFCEKFGAGSLFFLAARLSEHL